MMQSLQELCECAFEQGYGKITKARPGVYLPHIPHKIFKILEEIDAEEVADAP